MWDAIASIGSSLLGGLFGGDDEKKTTSEVDYVKMAANAEAAGFNKLTALRNGGAAGFTTTMGSGPSLSSRVGDALTAGAQAWSNYDPLKADRSEAELALLNAQIGNLNAQTAATVAAGNTVSTRGNAALSKDEAPKLNIFGLPVQRDSSMFASADAVQQEFGEPGEWVVGVPSLAQSGLNAVLSGGQDFARSLGEKARETVRKNSPAPKKPRPTTWQLTPSW